VFPGELVAVQGVTIAFGRNVDGSWTCTTPVTFHHPKGRMQASPGARFRQGELFMGVELAAWLDEQAKIELHPD
jgi:hypothetical protein